MGISGDGKTICYNEGATSYGRVATWNGSNFSDSTPLGSVQYTDGQKIRITSTGTTIFIGVTGGLYYSSWNGSSWNDVVQAPSSGIPTDWNSHAMTLSRDDTTLYSQAPIWGSTIEQTVLTYA